MDVKLLPNVFNSIVMDIFENILSRLLFVFPNPILTSGFERIYSEVCEA